MSQLVWLITGCSSGFGEQFVRSIVARGGKVIATARTLEKIEHLKQANVGTLQLDITDAQANINDTIGKALEVYGRIDVLVNNAAYIQVGTLEDLEHSDWVSQFDTNVFGTIKVTRALLPHFRERRSGTVLFISSLSGWIGHGFRGPYAGSKFTLEGIAEALYRETTPLGIRTLLVEPGRFRTALLSNSNRKTKQRTIADYATMSSAMSQGLDAEDSRQPGDPMKLVEIVLDLVRQDGVAQDRDVPLRLPLGVDSFDDVMAKCRETLKVLEEWKDVIGSTDIDSA